MADGPPSIDLRPANRYVPALRVISVLSLAFDIKKLAVAAVGFLLLHAGWWLCDAAIRPQSPIEAAFEWVKAPGMPWNVTPDAGLSMQTSWLSRPIEPYAVLAVPFARLIASGQSLRTMIHSGVCLIWAIVVWSFMGGTICRMAATQLALYRRAGLSEIWAFTRHRWISFLVAPLCPLMGMAICVLMALPFGLLYWIPWVGPVLAGLFFVIPLGLGLVITLLAAGLIAGWPLLPAAVAVGADDPLDALSRAFSYLNQRLGFYVLMLMGAYVVGLVGVVIVGTLAELVIEAARWSISITAPASVFTGMFGRSLESSGVASGVHGFWIDVVRLVAHAWVFSFFWSAAALMYLTLRHEVDGTQWSEIEPPASPKADRNSNLPLAKPAESQVVSTA